MSGSPEADPRPNESPPSDDSPPDQSPPSASPPHDSPSDQSPPSPPPPDDSQPDQSAPSPPPPDDSPPDQSPPSPPPPDESPPDQSPPSPPPPDESPPDQSPPPDQSAQPPPPPDVFRPEQSPPPPPPLAYNSPQFSPPAPPPDQYSLPAPAPKSIALPQPGPTGPLPHAPKSKVAVAAGSAAAGATVLLVLAVWLVMTLRKRRAAARGNRALEAAAATAPVIGFGGSSQAQPPNSKNIVYPPKSPPAGPLAPQNHHSLELTPPPTTATTAAASSDYLCSAASGGSSNSKSQPVSLPAGEVLFRGSLEYGELAAATNGFSDSNLLGRGGFGDVYVGSVDGTAVAVKWLRSGSQQGDPEFQAELRIISRVHHRDLVSLVGYCVADAGQRLLVYEFVPNLTLHHHLHGHPRIIHRDIKAANILLDHDFNPKVSDFGMAKFIPKESTHIATRIVGTIGYLAPEYASSGKLTEKSDVFSFGVVLLELITGMNASIPSDPDMEDTLASWARPLLARALELGDYDEVVDPLLPGYSVDQMARLVRCAAAAVSTSARRRPRMSQIVRHLAGDASAEEIDACGVRSSLGEAGSVDGADFRPMRYNEIRMSRRQASADKLHQS